jgi:MFS family permease
MSRPAGSDPEVPGETLSGGTLWGLLLSTALVPLGSTMVAVALTSIGEDLRAEPAALTQWLVNSYLVVGIVLQSPAGKLGDLWGARRALTLGQSLFAIGALLGFLGGTLPLLVGARVLMAAGGALMVPATTALLRRSTSAERRGRVFGAFGASMGLAAALGPLVGGVLVDAFGWRSIFLANVPILLAAAPLVRGAPGTAPRPSARPFDWTGSALLALGLTVAVAGSKAGGVSAVALLLLGGAILFGFLQWERRTPDPVLDPGLFRHLAFTAGGSLVALHNWVMYALLFQLPIWFATLTGAGSADIGQVMIAMMLSMVVCSPVGGRLSERVGSRALAVTGTLSMLVGLLLLTRLDLNGPSDAIPALILMGAGLGLAGPASQSAAVSAIPADRAGMAAGALSTMRYLGGVVGIGALGVILRDVGLGDAAGAPAAHQQAVWLYCAVTAVALLPAALLPGRAGRVGWATRAETPVVPGTAGAPVIAGRPGKPTTVR